MSIAELIMQGTNRASDSTAWVGDSLAKLGQNVGQALAQREQQKQAQEMLPLLQQNLKTAMTQAQAGKSGQAYSTLLGSIDPQMMNNPQMLPFIKLGFDAIGKSADDFLYSQKTGTSGLESMLPFLAMTNPQLASNLASQLQSNKQDFTTPNDVVEPDLPTGGGMDGQLYPEGGSSDAKHIPPSAVATPNQVGPTEQPQAPSRTQAVTAQGFKDINNALNSGVPFSSIMSESSKMIWDKDNIKPFSKGFKSIKGLDKYLPGVEGIAELDTPDQLRQKGMNVSSKGGIGLTFESVDPNYDYQKAKEPFIKTINDNLSILNSDSNLQKAIKAVGGFENIKFVTDRAGKYSVEIQKDGKRQLIPISKDTRDAATFIAGIPQAAKNAMMPLYGTEIEMPPVGRAKENLADLLK